LHQKNCLTIFHLASNIVRTYQSLGCHILALESDIEVFTEVLEPFVEMAMPEPDTKHVHNFNMTFLSRNVRKCCLIMSELSTCINIMHSFSYFCCMPHTFLFFYLQNVISAKELPSIRGGWNVLGSYDFFFATIICWGAQALALEFLASHPSGIVSQVYHSGVRAFVDDETLEDG
jgi:hypothetical protein